jgi:protein subunit release factor B
MIIKVDKPQHWTKSHEIRIEVMKETDRDKEGFKSATVDRLSKVIFASEILWPGHPTAKRVT